MSPLTQGRELKYKNRGKLCVYRWSPLTQGRELKYFADCPHGFPNGSPLTQGRELKSEMAAMQTLDNLVAPHTGA